MKRRRGRRGFWWWSWLLALVTIAGVVGGFFYGKKLWQDGPKDYLSSAKVSIHIRPPFVAKSAKLDDSGSRLNNITEEAVLRDIKSDEALAPIVTTLGLSKAWGLGTDDAVATLKSSVELDHERLMNELYVRVSRHDPVEAAQIANLIADGIYERVKTVDQQQKVEGEKKLELELQPFVQAEAEARVALKDALVAKGFAAEPEPGLGERPYLLDPIIRDAQLEWDSSRETLVGLKASQRAFENHWSKSVRPTIVVEKAVPAPGFYGPAAEPIQMQWALYGLTFGLILGSILSLICWKFFP